MITSFSNPRIKYARRLQNDSRFRKREKTFVVEGTRWLSELVHWQLKPKYVLYTESWLQTANHAEILHQIDAPIQLVDERLMAAISDTMTPAGVLAVVPVQPRQLPESVSLLLILDGVSNPGNVGTMLRTAAAAGVDGVLLAPGCVDVYNPKVVRGGMGAHLRLPIHHAAWHTIRALTRGLRVYVATVTGDLVYTAVNWREPAALIIGSEAVGASKEALSLADREIIIPMHAQTESLNAAMASGIILFEAFRQRNQLPAPE
ncbi:MAG: RNA methyltransferase [Chloroflexi bacterium]|nr:MAG: RNA methyltransferase [Chloroflexota bacterium]